MNATAAATETSVRLQRLIGFLDRDPGNMPLLTDAVSVALDERQFEITAGLIERNSQTPKPALLIYLSGFLSGFFFQPDSAFAKVGKSADFYGSREC